MGAVLASLLLTLRQLGDRRILRILLKSVAATLAIVAILAWGGWYLLDMALARAGLADTLFAGAGQARGLLSFALALIGLWLVWRIVAMAVIQFFADEVVQAVEARHYAAAAQNARDLPLAMQARVGLAAALRALLVNLAILPLALVLLATGVGTAVLFWAVNAVLIGRELQDMVRLRHLPPPTHAPAGEGGLSAPLGRMQRFALGGVVAVLLMLPFVNFLAPLLGAAGATHLIHRRGAR